MPKAHTELFAAMGTSSEALLWWAQVIGNCSSTLDHDVLTSFAQTQVLVTEAREPLVNYLHLQQRQPQQQQKQQQQQQGESKEEAQQQQQPVQSEASLPPRDTAMWPQGERQVAWELERRSYHRANRRVLLLLPHFLLTWAVRATPNCRGVKAALFASKSALQEFASLQQQDRKLLMREQQRRAGQDGATEQDGSGTFSALNTATLDTQFWAKTVEQQLALMDCLLQQQVLQFQTASSERVSGMSHMQKGTEQR